MKETQYNLARQESIHRGWMTGLLVSGIILVSTPFFMGGLHQVLGPDALGLWRSILTNFGTTLIMAGLLLVVEPKVRRAVTRAVSKTAETVAVAATASMRENILKDVQDDIEEKFGSLKERIEMLLHDDLAAQDKTVAAFADDYSYESARNAMQAAIEFNSLHQNQVIVQATDTPGQLCIGLRLVPGQPQGEYQYRQGEVVLDDMILELTGYTAATTGSSSVEWESADDFGIAIGMLVKNLERAGTWGRAASVDWDVVHRQLVEGLDVAVKSTRQQPGSLQLKGRLSEIIGKEQPWYVTDQSIENPARGFALLRQQFPQIYVQAFGAASESDLEKPDWVDQLTWDYVIQRGREMFTIHF